MQDGDNFVNDFLGNYTHDEIGNVSNDQNNFNDDREQLQQMFPIASAVLGPRRDRAEDQDSSEHGSGRCEFPEESSSQRNKKPSPQMVKASISTVAATICQHTCCGCSGVDNVGSAVSSPASTDEHRRMGPAEYSEQVQGGPMESKPANTVQRNRRLRRQESTYDVCEVFSQARMTEQARKQGLRGGLGS